MKKHLTIVLVSMMVLFFLTTSGMTADKELKIGVSVCMSGPGAGWFLPPYQGIVMHAEEINARGGINIGGENYTIKVIGEDNKYTTAGAVAAMEKLVHGEKVHVMFTGGGAPMLATQEALEKNKILSFMLVWNARHRGTKFPYSFSVGMIPVDFGLDLFSWVKENYDVKTACVVSRVSESGADTGGNAVKFAKMAGIDVVKYEKYETGTTDFFPIVSRMLSAKPDAVIAGEVSPRDGALILKLRDELGGTFKYIDWAGQPETMMKLAPNACEKDFIFRYQDVTSTAEAKAFDERYRKRWNGEESAWTSQEGYEFLGVYTKAVQIAGKIDSDSVKAALEDPNFEYDGLFGKYRFGGKSIYGTNCEMYYPIGVGVIQEGKIKAVANIPVTTK